MISPISDWQFKEILSPSAAPTVGANIVELNVPLDLTDRRVYAYVEMKQSAGADFIYANEVVLYNGGQLIAKYPLEIGQLSNNTHDDWGMRSLQCFFNAGGSPVGDCLVITPNDGFTGATKLSQILQPVRISAKIDRAVLNTTNVQGGSNTGFRIFFGVLSERSA